MRELTSHKVNGLNEAIKIFATDEPSNGGASHNYEIYLSFDPCDHTGLKDRKMVLPFQKGPIKEAGFNGITSEVLLTILEDRHAGFQSGPFSNPESQEALDHIRGALEALKRRTLSRMSRGVEGTHQK